MTRYFHAEHEIFSRLSTMKTLKEALASLILTDPRVLLLRVLRKLNLISWHAGAIQRIAKRFPYYDFGLLAACEEATALGYKGITAIEFGVAGGNGLRALAVAARNCEKVFGIRVQVLGFDSGEGMPAHKGYQDAPHMWSQGDFKMDRNILRKALAEEAQVILGNVSKTVEWWLHKQTNSPEADSSENSPSSRAHFSAELLNPQVGVDFDLPIAFVAFDLDYWSSTASALKILSRSSVLPRVWCYFDDLDTISTQTGEWLAIEQFNNKDKSRFMSRCTLSSPSWVNWEHKMMVLHSYGHPKYVQPLFKNLQLPLT